MMILIDNILKVSSELAPWLFLGLFLSSIIHYFVPDSFFRRHLGGGDLNSVLKSVLFGVPMPLCSCGVIPVAISLKKQGAGEPASLGFLISTPQTGVDSVFVSAAMLGWPFAILKLISALMLGFLGGVISIITGPSTANSGDLAIGREPYRGRKAIVSIYTYAINDLLYMIWRWLLVGIVVSAAISTWLPPEAFSDFESMGLFLTLLIVLFISLPLYICATSSVPIAAALVHAGMPPSAALVFLLAGPATNMATVGAVYKGLGLKSLVIYLSVIIIGSLSLAYFFDFVLVDAVATGHEHGSAIGGFFGVLLLLVLLYFLIKDFSRTKLKLVSDDELDVEISVTVEGMTCDGCVNKLTSTFMKEGVENVIVSKDRKSISVVGKGISYEHVVTLVEKAGFAAR